MDINQPRVLEIRVHGVRDTRHWESLGVAEDETLACQPPPPGSDAKSITGFFCRIRNHEQPELHHTGLHVEAYSWGALTSRTIPPAWASRGSCGSNLAAGWVTFRETATRALWLLLAPFAFVNLAMWARPAFMKAGPRNFAAAVMIRWAGLLLTALLIATVCGIAIDLLAWQCFRNGIPYCVGTLSPVLEFKSPDVRIAVASLVPVLTLSGLCLLSQKSIGRYEAKAFEDGATEATDPTHALRRSEFWLGKARTSSLLRLHLALGLCTISLATTAPIQAISGSSDWPLPLWAAAIMIPAIFACNAVGVLDQIEYSHAKKLQNLCRQGPGVLLALAVAVLAASYAWLLSGRYSSLDQRGQLPLTADMQIIIIGFLFILVAFTAALFATWWYAIIASVIVGLSSLVHILRPDEIAANAGAIAGLLLAAYFVGVFIHFRSRTGDVLTWAWFGFGPIHLLAFAVFLGVMFSSVATLFSAAVMDRRLNPAELFPAATGIASRSVSGEGLTVPGPFLWFVTLFTPGLAMASVIVAFVVLYFKARASNPLKVLSAAESSEADEPIVYKARLKAAVVHRVETLLGAVAVIPLTAGLFAAYAMMSGLPLNVPVLTTVGLWVAIGFGLLVATIVIAAALHPESRRSIGVLWDLSTFWPRAAQPFSPPCYGERVVPELTDRVRSALSGRTEKKQPCLAADSEASPRYDYVILSGHSLGSAILAAVILQLSDAEIERIRFVSYGSQLRAWFGRFFPDLLGPAVLGHEKTSAPTFRSSTPDAPQLAASYFQPPDSSLAHLLRGSTHWRSFFRRTDPLGFRVFQDAENDVDCYLNDWEPTASKPPKEAGLTPTKILQTHGSYQGSDDYNKLIKSWLSAADDDSHSREHRFHQDSAGD